MQHAEVFPTQAGRERKTSSDFPCILNKQTELVVVEMTDEARRAKRRINLLTGEMALRIDRNGVEGERAVNKTLRAGESR